MDKLRGRRSKGFLGGLLFGIGKESCQQFRDKLQALADYLEPELEASNESVKLAEQISKTEVTIAENDGKIDLYATYSKEQQKVIKASTKEGKQQLTKARKEAEKTANKKNNLLSLASSLQEKIQ